MFVNETHYMAKLISLPATKNTELPFGGEQVLVDETHAPRPPVPSTEGVAVPTLISLTHIKGYWHTSVEAGKRPFEGKKPIAPKPKWSDGWVGESGL